MDNNDITYTEGYASVTLAPHKLGTDTIIELPGGGGVVGICFPKDRGSASFVLGGLPAIFATCTALPTSVEIAPSALIQGF